MMKLGFFSLMLPAPFEKRLLDSMGEAVVALDTQYVVTHWNRGAALLLGWEAAEAVGHRGTPADLEASSPAAQTKLREYVAAGRTWQGLLRLRRRRGELVSIDATVSPLRDDSGAVVGLV
ncbi:MAG TPA: PAS domain-containing protein, partial [Pseudomonadota bacterium]|nr:PAS domain-containing protein [Pseudomonadota bacterium]